MLTAAFSGAHWARSWMTPQEVQAHCRMFKDKDLSPDDTLLYYKQVYIPLLARHQFICVVVKIRQGIRFFYNYFPQQSGKVKGHRGIPPPSIWYVAPGQNLRSYGLSGGDD